ncbi:hypothetical protein [Halomonas aquatica]|uniref:Uncharacterized protein n=1 Tax=Halomonas aquatica TaxID=3151123 RepID=A0ABV1NF06_9GAMM
MKQQNSRQPMDERDKLRKFRELDDAFAEALRGLESPGGEPTGPSDAAEVSLERESLERQLLEGQKQDAAARARQEQARQHAFEQRLKALMNEYAQPEESVSRLLETLRSLGRIA